MLFDIKRMPIRIIEVSDFMRKNEIFWVAGKLYTHLIKLLYIQTLISMYGVNHMEISF